MNNLKCTLNNIEDILRIRMYTNVFLMWGHITKQQNNRSSTYRSVGDTIVIGIIVASISDAIAISVFLSRIGRVNAIVLYEFSTRASSIVIHPFFQCLIAPCDICHRCTTNHSQASRRDPDPVRKLYRCQHSRFCTKIKFNKQIKSTNFTTIYI